MKKYSRSYNYGKRINPMSIGISLVIAFIWCTSGGYDDTYVADKPVVSVFMTATVVEATTTPSLEDKIREYFPRSWKTMIAVAHAESGMDMNAKGWNCYYNADETIVYSTRVKGAHSGACKKEHRSFAWSVDCFLLQRNYKGQECPYGITLDDHLKDVAELSKVQGLSAWVSYNRGAHLKYLSQK